VTASAVLSVTNDTPYPLNGGIPPVGDADVAVNGAVSTSPLALPPVVEPGVRVIRAIPLVPSNLSGASDQAQVRVHVTGPLEAEADGTVQIRDMPTSARQI
jgi:hypothetical protein